MRTRVAFLIIALGFTTLLAVDKRVDRAVGRELSASEHNVVVANRSSVHATAGKRPPAALPKRIVLFPLKFVLNHRIAATRQRIIASLHQDPDDFDARDLLWQRLHRLQTWRDSIA